MVIVFMYKHTLMIKEIVRKQILNLKPYTPEERGFPVMLDANESPFQLPAGIKAGIMKKAGELAFNRYPDPLGNELKKAISRALSVTPDKIVLGNGSDELILYLIAAFGRRGYNVLYPVPTFSMYGIIANCLGNNGTGIPLTEKFELDRSAFIKTLKERKISIVFFSYPNNPTGNCFSRETILEVIKTFKGIVVVDEAYGDFSGKTFLPLINKYRNLVILKTFSKIGLSSLRLGYLISNPEVAGIVEKVRLPFNVNSFSQACGEVFASKKKTMQKYIDEIIKGREYLFKELVKFPGIIPFNSEANFILFRVVGKSGFLHSELKKRGILIRNLNQKGLLSDCLRVTVGTVSENRIFIKAMTELCKRSEK